MTGTRTLRVVLAVFAPWLFILFRPTVGLAQDALAHAKDLYTSAAYDEALAALTGYDAPPDHAIEADEYRVFCLLALGKGSDATKIIEQIVAADPSFLPAENQASPRVQEAFRDVRRRVLPSIVRNAYTEAKSSFDRKDYQTAAQQFDRVLTLLKEPAAAGSSDLADLRVLSNGFLDLIKTASAPSPPPASVPSASTRPTPLVYGIDDEGVVPPVAVSQVLPPWRPSKQEPQTYAVTLILAIDETGGVASLRIDGILPSSYGAQLRDAVRHWKYHPATKNGVPVKFQKVVGIRLNPANTRPSAETHR